MIRGLRFTDVPLQLLPGRLPGQDLATAHEEIATTSHRLSPLELARWSVAPAKNERHFAADRHGRLEALAILRPRRGPRAWEVAHLFAVSDGDQAVADLLERTVGFVASQRGERLFIRVRSGSPIQQVAERSGFRSAGTEDVYSLPHAMTGDLQTSGLDMRPPLSADTYGMFRLYNATFPPMARAAIGLTLDQWLDSGECGLSNTREYVWERQGGIGGWVRLIQRGRSVAIDALLHPDEDARTASFVSYVARLAWGHRRPTWIVPTHQTAVARELKGRGWQHARSYVVLARTVATPVADLAFAPGRARAPGGMS